MNNKVRCRSTMLNLCLKNTHTSGPFVKLWTEPFAKLQRRLILRLKKTLRCSTNRFFQILAPSGGTYQHERRTYFRMRMHHFFTVLFDQIFFYDKTYLLHTMFLDFAKNLVKKEFEIFIYAMKQGEF